MSAIGTLRELDSRNTNGITVTLLWSPETEETYVEISTNESCEVFPVPAAEARQAFDHPYVYATV